MRLLFSCAGQFLWFGALCMLMAAYDPQPPAVTAFAACGELAATGLLCSLIVRQMRQGTIPAWAMDVVTGFALSHICILDLLNPGCSAALAWLQLTLQVSLLLVLTTTAGVLFKARIRDRVGARLRLVFAALAEDGRNGRA